MVVFFYDADLDDFPDESKKGVWKGAKIGDRRSAMVACPDCGKVFSLSNHTIGLAGNVSPSLVCPFECGFDELARLDGWTP